MARGPWYPEWVPSPWFSVLQVSLPRRSGVTLNVTFHLGVNLTWLPLSKFTPSLQAPSEEFHVIVHGYFRRFGLMGGHAAVILYLNVHISNRPYYPE